MGKNTTRKSDAAYEADLGALAFVVPCSNQRNKLRIFPDPSFANRPCKHRLPRTSRPDNAEESTGPLQMTVFRSNRQDSPPSRACQEAFSF